MVGGNVSRRPSDFDITKTLFVGKRSVIYRAVCLGCGFELVLKVYVKNRLAAVHRKQVEREIQIHSAIKHRNIVDMYAAFEDDNHVYLMLESASKGDLLDDMNKRETFYPQETIKHFMRQILDTINYLHKKGIMHRDMKPENIVLVDNKYSVKIIDFGLSIDFSAERPVSAVGTLQYMAPEVVVCPTKSRPEENKDNPMLQYGTGADIWAIGVLAFELLTGRAPFDTGKKGSEEETEQRIMYMEPEYPADMDPEAADFVRRTISKVSSRRPTAAELLCHQWFTGGSPENGSSAAATRQPTGTGNMLGFKSSHNDAVAAAGGRDLRVQMSMADVHDGAASRPVLATEKSVPEGTDPQSWLYSEDRLRAPVRGSLKVTGVQERAEPVGRDSAKEREREREESDKDSAFMRPEGCGTLAPEPTEPSLSANLVAKEVALASLNPDSTAARSPSGAVRRVGRTHSPWQQQQQAQELSSEASAAKGSSARTLTASSPPSRQSLSRGQPQQRSLASGGTSAKGAQHLHLASVYPTDLHTAVSSSRTAGYIPPGGAALSRDSPACFSPRLRSGAISHSSSVSRITHGAHVEASLRQSLLLAEASAPSLGIGPSARSPQGVPARALAGEASEGALGLGHERGAIGTFRVAKGAAANGGLDSYGALRAALESSSRPSTVHQMRPGTSHSHQQHHYHQQQQQSASSVRAHQRPGTSQHSVRPRPGPVGGRSTVTGIKAPSFARWSAKPSPASSGYDMRVQQTLAAAARASHGPTGAFLSPQRSQVSRPSTTAGGARPSSFTRASTARKGEYLPISPQRPQQQV